jgi:hypothetical protein
MFLKAVLLLLIALVFGGTLIAMYQRARDQQQDRTIFFRFEFARVFILVAIVAAGAVYGLWDKVIAPLLR